MSYLKRIKKSLLIVFFAVQTIFIQAQSDTTYTGNIIVETQEEVNALRTTLSGKTRINGNLTIGYTDYSSSRSNITDLTPLSNIVRIAGNVLIQYNGQLANLNALNNLQTVGGDFRIRNNDRLTTLGDFPVLQTIGGYFYVYNNDKLTSLGDFPILQSIEGYLYVYNNDSLTDLGDFSNLQTIGGYFSVNNNEQLTSLGNFPALTSIGVGNPYVLSARNHIGNTSIVVEDNTSLSDCCTLTEFLTGGTHAVSGGIYINNNAVGCNSGDEIKASAVVVAPPTLMVSTFEDTTINHDATEALDITFTLGGSAVGWESIVIGDNFITLDPDMNASDTNTEVTVVAAYEVNTGLERTDTIIFMAMGGVADTVVITQAGTPPVPELDLISAAIDTISYNATSLFIFTVANATWEVVSDEDFVILYRSGVASEYIDTVDVYLSANTTGMLRTAIIRITATGTDGTVLTDSVTITQEAALPDYIYTGNITVTTQTEVDALSTTLAGKTRIDGNLTIGYASGNSLSNITDLTPLSNMTHITENLRIQQNGELENLNDLNNLQTIGGYFAVSSNAQLTTLGNFSDLQTIGGYFWVSSNSELRSLGSFPTLTSGSFPTLTSIGIGETYIPSLGEFRDSVSIVVEDNSSLFDCCVLTNFLSTGVMWYWVMYISTTMLWDVVPWYR